MKAIFEDQEVGEKKVSLHLVLRVVAGITGSALIYYGRRKKQGLLSGLVSAVGFSLVAKSIGRSRLASV
jgi:hypothetical protein